MKNIIIVIICLFSSHLLSAQGINDLATDQIILKFKKNQKPKPSVSAFQSFGNQVLDELNVKYNFRSIRLTGNKKNGDTFVLELPPNTPLEAIMDSYQKTGFFEYVEPNYRGKGHGAEIIPDDPRFTRQWGHVNDGTFSLSTATVDADIDSDLAWDITTGDPDMIVAILDSGAKLDHPEFSGRLWNNNEVIDGTDSDGNNYIDDLNGWDFANDDNDATDDHGHGTNVAGIALASGNNATGYAGMNWNAQIMTCKVLDDENNGFYSWWAEAMYYAVDNGASVINLSAGGFGSSNLLEQAINYAYLNNVPVVVSSGNSNSVIEYPAKYENAFAIGSTNADDTRSVPFFWNATTGSNFGAELDFVAPGNYIYGLSYSSNSNFNSYWGGTSQAAPHVTGLISLLLSVDETLTIDEIRMILEETSEDQVGEASEDTAGWDPYYGHGRINAFQALSSLMEPVNTFESIDKNVLIYPNPLTTNNPLAISNLADGLHTIRIYNAVGQLLYSEQVASDNAQITLLLPKLKSGTYFFRIKDSSGNNAILEKLIIN